MGIYIQESHTNEDEGYLLGEPYEYETFADAPGELFRSILKDGWRCTSSVYRETADGKVQRIGWYFEKTDKYEDTGEPYKHGMWVTLLERPTEHRTIQHPMSI